MGSYEIRKYQENLKISQNYSLVPSLPSKNENFVNISKKLLKNRNWWTFPIVHYSTRKPEFVSNILSMIVVSVMVLLIWLLVNHYLFCSIQFCLLSALLLIEQIYKRMLIFSVQPTGHRMFHLILDQERRTHIFCKLCFFLAWSNFCFIFHVWRCYFFVICLWSFDVLTFYMLNLPPGLFCVVLRYQIKWPFWFVSFIICFFLLCFHLIIAVLQWFVEIR